MIEIETIILFLGLFFTGIAILLNSESRKTALLHDMIKEERRLSIDFFKFTHLLKGQKPSEQEVKFLIISHLNFYEHLALLIKKHKMGRKVAKGHFKKLLINTVEVYKKQNPEYLSGFEDLNKLYEEWKNENRGGIDLNNIDWKKIGIEAFVGFIFTIIALSLFTFVINPAITDKPNVELITKNPLFFDEGYEVTFNFTLENTGEATAKNLLVWAYEESSSEEPQVDTASISKDIMQKDDICYAELEMTAPENQQPNWIIKLYITTTDGYGWEYHVIYKYDTTTNKYKYYDTDVL